MTKGLGNLHSHSALERELRLPKGFVIVDAKYKGLFNPDTVCPYELEGVRYIIVPILRFVELGGVFKNLKQ